MLISEIYESRQGEGILTGTPSVFVRTSGCNLRCQFCDTPYTSWNPEGEKREIEPIVNQLREFESRNVVITGGEPLIQSEIVQLTRRLKLAEYHITIETAGTVFRDVTCDLMSISPKMSNSTPDSDRAGQWSVRHERTRRQPEIVNRLIANFDYQLKFVVADRKDLTEIEQYLERLDEYDPGRTLLMPEGIDTETLAARSEWLIPLCEQKQFVYCPRMHIEWYGNRRGT